MQQQPSVVAGEKYLFVSKTPVREIFPLVDFRGISFKLDVVLVMTECRLKTVHFISVSISVFVLTLLYH